MSQKLQDIYRSILRFAGMEADAQGYISTAIEDKREPAFINGLRMVLPTDHHLRSFDPKEKIIFHPFTENILRGESEVIEKLKKVLNIRLNYTIGVVGSSLLSLVASPEQHHKLSPEQAELLTSITDADDKSVSNFISLMVSAMKSSPERVFTNVYLKRGGTFDGKRFSRVGIVTFPMYEQLQQDKIEKIRVKDKETYRQLFDFIFPGLENIESYNFGSDSHIAPYLEALMRTSANIASRLNDILLTYKDYIDNAEAIMFDPEWMEEFQDLAALAPEIRKVPVQFGNDGVIPAAEKQAEKQVQYVAPAQPVQPQYQPQQPQMVSMVPQAPEVRKTSRGLDFQSVLAAQPGLAYAPNPLAAQLAATAPYVAPAVPGWAAPQMQQQQMAMGQPYQTPNGWFMALPNGAHIPVIHNGQGWVPAQQQQPMMNNQPSWAAPSPQYYMR
jgi:hypothetical protein